MNRCARVSCSAGLTVKLSHTGMSAPAACLISEGLAACVRDGKLGVIDKSGKAHLVVRVPPPGDVATAPPGREGERRIVSARALPGGLVVVADVPDRLIRAVWLLRSNSKEWTHIASLATWHGPSPIARLDSDRIAIGAMDKIIFLDTSLKGPQTPAMARLPDGMHAARLLDGDATPGVVLYDGNVLTLTRSMVWARHALRLPFPEERSGTARQGASDDTFTIETVATTAEGDLHFSHDVVSP